MIKDSVINPLPNMVPPNSVRPLEARSEDAARVAREESGVSPLAAEQTDDQSSRPVAVVLPAEEELADIVDALNTYLQTAKRELQFETDTTSGRTIIKVLDRESQEVIRQIPPESVVALAQSLLDQGDLDSFGLKERA
jgi:flagellar protein FlaG